jgi:hypothetical protein
MIFVHRRTPLTWSKGNPIQPVVHYTLNSHISVYYFTAKYISLNFIIQLLLMKFVLTTRNSFIAPGFGGGRCALHESIIPTDAFAHRPTP